MLKIGVLGAGHLGKIHIRLLKEIPDFDLVGFYDQDENTSAIASAEYGIKAFNNIDQLIDSVDVIDIVTPTISHYTCAKKALEKGKHVFIEKPITNTVEEGAQLLELEKLYHAKIQVGHVERFNAAFLAAQPYLHNPMFIETHRLAQFNPRGTDVSVVLDLMIHDIDIVLSVVKSPLKNIHSSGVAVVSYTPDIANARLEFENGCVANLTSSRLSMKNMRKSRFFQRDAYIAVDFLKKKTEVIRLKSLEGEADPLSITIDLGKEKGQKVIYFENPSVEENNAIKTELEVFAKAIINNTQTVVTGRDGYDALKVAHNILENLKLVSSFA